MTPLTAYLGLSPSNLEGITLVRVGEFFETFKKDAVLLHALTVATLTKRDNVTMSGFHESRLEDIKVILKCSGLSVVLIEINLVDT